MLFYGNNKSTFSRVAICDLNVTLTLWIALLIFRWFLHVVALKWVCCVKFYEIPLSDRTNLKFSRALNLRTNIFYSQQRQKQRREHPHHSRWCFTNRWCKISHIYQFEYLMTENATTETCKRFMLLKQKERARNVTQWRGKWMSDFNHSSKRISLITCRQWRAKKLDWKFFTLPQSPATL